MNNKDDPSPVAGGETKSGQQFVIVGCGMVGVVLAIEMKRRFPDCSIKLVRGSKLLPWYVFAVQITPISYAS